MLKSLSELIPGIGKIVDDLVTSDEEVREKLLEEKIIDTEVIKARLGVQKAWLSNKSPYVAGAIPTILWMISLVIFFNHVFAPVLVWLSGANVPTLDLPGYYVEFGKWIVLGLFGKKAWDSSEVKIGGLYSPKKQEE
jgi:hypothetical protein